MGFNHAAHSAESGCSYRRRPCAASYAWSQQGQHDANWRVPCIAGSMGHHSSCMRGLHQNGSCFFKVGVLIFCEPGLDGWDDMALACILYFRYGSVSILNRYGPINIKVNTLNLSTQQISLIWSTEWRTVNCKMQYALSWPDGLDRPVMGCTSSPSALCWPGLFEGIMYSLSQWGLKSIIGTIWIA